MVLISSANTDIIAPHVSKKANQRAITDSLSYPSTIYADGTAFDVILLYKPN